MGNEKTHVLDASAILALSFAEKHATWVADQMEASEKLLISAVTVTEVMIQLRGRQPESAPVFVDWLDQAGVSVVPVDTAQALAAASARRTYPLNIGDCFVYTLAKKENAAIVTLDQDFKNCDAHVLLPPKS